MKPVDIILQTDIEVDIKGFDFDEYNVQNHGLKLRVHGQCIKICTLQQEIIDTLYYGNYMQQNKPSRP